MQNPLHEELTPVAGLEDRIEATLAAVANDRPESLHAQLFSALATSSTGATATKRRRIAVATALIVVPVALFGIAASVIGVDVSGNFPFGSSAVPSNIGHTAPIFDPVSAVANTVMNGGPQAAPTSPPADGPVPAPVTASSAQRRADTPAVANHATTEDCPDFLSVVGVTQLRILGQSTCPSEQADILQGPFQEFVERDGPETVNSAALSDIRHAVH